MIAAALLGLFGGFLAPLGLVDEALDDDDGEGGILAFFRAGVGSLLLILTVVFLGGALLLHLGVGDAVIKPVVSLISRWIEFLTDAIQSIISPVLKFVGI